MNNDVIHRGLESRAGPARECQGVQQCYNSAAHRTLDNPAPAARSPCQHANTFDHVEPARRPKQYDDPQPMLSLLGR